MTWDEISEYQEMMEDPERTEESANIQGIWFEESYRRVYPNDTLACDVIGFTRSDGVGLYGLEEYYNDTLSGVTGRLSTAIWIRTKTCSGPPGRRWTATASIPL